MRRAFGSFELDGQRRLLLREGAVVPLGPKAFFLLEILLDRWPAAVSKEELVAELWGGAAVSDTALTTVVNELRRALGESGRERRFVRTIHGHGYAFEDEPRRLLEPGLTVRGWLIGVREKIALADGETVLSRVPGQQGSIEDPSVSRRHARIRCSAREVTIEDLGSRNGTRIRGEPVVGAVRLENGDEVMVGLVSMRFLSGAIDPGGETPAFRSRPPGR